jgi:hypothetical protein
MSSYLSFMFDSEWRQRQDIDSVSSLAEGMADNVANLGSQVTRLRAQVHELSVTVAVLMRVLTESNTIDASVLKYRVEAELEEIAHARANPAAQTVARVTCGTVVPSARTVLTGDGAICDGCAAGTTR